MTGSDPEDMERGDRWQKIWESCLNEEFWETRCIFTTFSLKGRPRPVRHSHKSAGVIYYAGFQCWWSFWCRIHEAYSICRRRQWSGNRVRAPTCFLSLETPLLFGEEEIRVLRLRVFMTELTPTVSRTCSLILPSVPDWQVPGHPSYVYAIGYPVNFLLP